MGKACLPVEVLLLPRRLTPEEYEIVKEHAVLGSQIARPVISPAQLSWVRSHHERWDGRGYPDGLADHEIPHGAAILGVADAWDAMIHRSFTGTALTEAEALEECRRESGLQFSPEVVDALERVYEAGRLVPRRPIAHAAAGAGRLSPPPGSRTGPRSLSVRTWPFGGSSARRTNLRKFPESPGAAGRRSW